MENQNEITLWSQFCSVIWSHLYMSLVTLAFGFGAFWWFIVQPGWKELYSAICMVIYFCVLYSKGAKIARQDLRSFSTQKPYALKGVVLSLAISVLTFLIWVMFRITWVYMTIDGSISGYSGIVYNFAFMIWTFCYNGFMCIYKGGIHWYAHILIYVFPALSLGIGYFAGYKGFSFADRAIKGMYEGRKN